MSNSFISFTYKRSAAYFEPDLDSIERVERVSPTGRAGRQLLPEYRRPGGGGAGEGRLGRVLRREGVRLFIRIG